MIPAIISNISISYPEVSLKHLQFGHSMGELFSGLSLENKQLFCSSELIGSAYQVRLNQEIQLFANELNFVQDAELTYHIHDQAFLMSFCLGAEMFWYDKIQEQEHLVKEGQYVIYRKGQHQEVHHFEKRAHYQGITLFIDHSKIDSILAESGYQKHPFLYEGVSKPIDVSTESLNVLHRMMHCDFRGGLKKLYMESQILELLFHCVTDEQNKISCANDKGASFSRTDRIALQEARILIDNMGCKDLTLSEIARHCAINECKLKNGFKELFGQTVHQYVVERRLRLALILLQQGKRTIEDISQAVGYQTVSGFYRAFVKKFGCCPSEMTKRHPYRK